MEKRNRAAARDGQRWIFSLPNGSAVFLQDIKKSRPSG
jgi:hypothetical protein